MPAITADSDSTQRTTLEAEIAQRPHLPSLSAEIERRIQRAKEQGIPRPDLIEPAETRLPSAERESPSSAAAEIERRIRAARQQSVAPLQRSHADTSDVAELDDRNKALAYEQAQVAESSPVEQAPRQTAASAPIQPSSTAASAVAELQRRIAQAAQSRLDTGQPAQGPTGDRPSLSQSTQPSSERVRTVPSPSLPPQVRRMRAASQIEEIGSQSRGDDDNLPLARPVSEAQPVSKADVQRHAETTTSPLVQDSRDDSDSEHISRAPKGESSAHQEVATVQDTANGESQSDVNAHTSLESTFKQDAESSPAQILQSSLAAGKAQLVEQAEDVETPEPLAQGQPTAAEYSVEDDSTVDAPSVHGDRTPTTPSAQASIDLSAASQGRSDAAAIQRSIDMDKAPSTNEEPAAPTMMEDVQQTVNIHADDVHGDIKPSEEALEPQVEQYTEVAA
ncbi:MAG: hypothetical protein KDE47_18685, partial [Caldilineaceae bacterium]|nr:hypothetical protein [Caldilineaceae bacterium]